MKEIYKKLLFQVIVFIGLINTITYEELKEVSLKLGRNYNEKETELISKFFTDFISNNNKEIKELKEYIQKGELKDFNFHRLENYRQYEEMRIDDFVNCLSENRDFGKAWYDYNKIKYTAIRDMARETKERETKKKKILSIYLFN